jgi:hypothetical protein
VESGGIGCGVVYQLEPKFGTHHWVETVIYSFCSQGGEDCTDGYDPSNGLIVDPSGNLYGTTIAGGAPGLSADVVFELENIGGSWVETVLHRFCTLGGCLDGAFPTGGLSLDSSGNLYGTTARGGGNDGDIQFQGGGTVFRLTGNKLKSFTASAPCRIATTANIPFSGAILDSAGDLIGNTELGGVRPPIIRHSVAARPGSSSLSLSVGQNGASPAASVNFDVTLSSHSPA